MKLITLVQVSDAEDEDEASIAKLLTVSHLLHRIPAHWRFADSLQIAYIISPILSFTVVASLQAAKASI